MTMKIWSPYLVHESTKRMAIVNNMKINNIDSWLSLFGHILCMAYDVWQLLENMQENRTYEQTEKLLWGHILKQRNHGVEVIYCSVCILVLKSTSDSLQGSL